MDLNELALMFTKLESTLVQRLDDIVRRIDGFERRLDKHQDEIQRLKDQVNIWKGAVILLSFVVPITIKVLWG